MRPAPTVPVSTAKPWVRARRLLWGSGFRSGARLPRYSRSGPSRHIAAPALSGPVPAEASRPRSVPVRVIHRSWASPGPNEMSSTAKALKETSGFGIVRQDEPASLSRETGEASFDPVPLGSFASALRPPLRNPFAVPRAEALIPLDCLRGKWVRLPPRASSLRACPTAFLRLQFLRISVAFQRLVPLVARFRFRSLASGHVLKLTQIPIRTKRNLPVDK